MKSTTDTAVYSYLNIKHLIKCYSIIQDSFIENIFISEQFRNWMQYFSFAFNPKMQFQS